MASVLALHFLDGVHIRFCGNGHARLSPDEHLHSASRWGG